ncbi:Protein kinase-like domain protein [Niveomyces insectorum RCEF 264]|uniref:EKC/KEOPS complex subunit BUD32 n=1 Tax=Niveomyces insectorum RCEF 264 TaxID=1081102 RepID=A0A162MR02_9HYPO|nr:Protein kinase-like domain protein [Niveomyces insectorum RCEF 264]
MSVFERLLRLPFAGIGKLCLAAISRCASWWTRLVAFLGWQPVQAAAIADKNDDIPSPPPHAAATEEKPQGRPRTITYVGVAGDWERELHPNWSEQVFQVPADVPYGTIYYVRKGTHAGFGMTAHIERAPEGHVVKTPKANPYDPLEEEGNRADMRIEAEVYRRVGPDCPYIPKMIGWDQNTCCLSLEYLENGPLSLYIKGLKSPRWEENPPDIAPALRRRWALQATRGLSALHSANVIHGDLTPRNVLLDADFNVRVADFAGSCIDGARYKICAGERYLVPGWSFRKTPEPADDLFLLGGLIYFIMTSKEPHQDVASEFDVAKLLEAGQFPDVAGLDCGAVIQGCWNGSLKSAEAVLEQLLAVFGTDDDPLVQTM